MLDNGGIGDLGSPNTNAGSSALFASPLSGENSQLFITFDYRNFDLKDPHNNTRLDLNHSNDSIGNRVLIGAGALNEDLFSMIVEENLHGGSGVLIAETTVGSLSNDGEHTLIGLLDFEFGQIAIWVDPDESDFYNPNTGNNSAEVAITWLQPAIELSNFVSYSLIRNVDDDVRFDNLIIANDPLSVGLLVQGILLGDVNRDGSVDLLDVAPFVELLTNGGFQAQADINQDGAVDLLDVAPFVELLSGG